MLVFGFYESQFDLQLWCSMEMPGRGSSYTLLSQNQDEPFHQQPPSAQQPKFSAGGGGYVVQQPLYYEPRSAEKNKPKSERAGALDWDAIDQRMIQPQSQQSRIGGAGFSGSFGLQRQSSGSSFGESSISGDYHVSSLSNPEVAFTHPSDGGAEFRGKTGEVSAGARGSSYSKSWAQQTEESYQLQLALALRLSAEATCADDPNFLDPVPDESSSAASTMSCSPEAISHRFWVTSDNFTRGFFIFIWGLQF